MLGRVSLVDGDGSAELGFRIAEKGFGSERSKASWSVLPAPRTCLPNSAVAPTSVELGLPAYPGRRTWARRIGIGAGHRGDSDRPVRDRGVIARACPMAP